MKAVHFGAGNIGRGFIGYLLSKSEYSLTFVDISDFLVDSINKYKEYTVITLSTSENKEKVHGVDAINIKDVEALEQAVIEADLITMSIGAPNLKSTGSLLKNMLEKRMKVSQKKVDIIACENAIMATDMLKTAIVENMDKAFIEYLDNYVGFPNSAVDRIVPNVNIEKELPIDVAVEDFYEWDIEKNKVKANADIFGAEYVEMLDPYLERKLFLLNGAHATTAYLGYIKGYNYIHEAIKDEYIRNVVINFHKEAVEALSKKHGIDIELLTAYSEKLIKRFENQYLQDEVFRVGRDPVRKLASNDRLITPLVLCKELGISSTNIVTGIAAGLLFDYKDDPKAQEVQEIIKNKTIQDAITEVCGLAKDNVLVEEIVSKYNELKAMR
ncbi:mannitol-1-phosphate 5-dehydrogenase [Clostridium sp. C8-1-8]|uniref:mannitol-1-phosphate 5-dehydrogenase n=1 Tax=Clostridium sp. C8-1-8 TaxID=2698831 RepID=UPI0013694E14|nr:mannitol-1-phosphate 5-dehydrogenase [Clostridium sp. C8-1-8]